MTGPERLAAIRAELNDVAVDWSDEALHYVISKYINAEELKTFAVERVKALSVTAGEYGFEAAVGALMAWLDGFAFGARFVDGGIPQ